MRPVNTSNRGIFAGGLTTLCVFCLVVLVSVPQVSTAQAADPLFARLETGAGDILLVFYPELAPHHVGNFVHLSRTGFYDGTLFHRIVPGIVIQGGDPNSKDQDPRNDGRGGPTMTDVLDAEDLKLVQQVNTMLDEKGYAGLDGPANLKAEFSRTAKHIRGTLSMARSQNVDSAGSQFFICVAPNPQWNGKYSIFGHVVVGMDVVDVIANGEKNPAAGRDAPRNPVAIEKVTVIEGVAGLNETEKAAWDAMPVELQSVK